MSWPRRRQALFYAGLLLFLTFFTLIITAIWSVPSELHLVRGETGRLRVRFPLRLLAPDSSRAYLAGSAFHGAELLFRSPTAAVFQVELRLLGAFPLRRVAVKVLDERKVIAGGHAIGVLLAAEGLVVVGHRPLRGIDGTQRYPANEAGIEVGDVILRANGITIRSPEDLAHQADAACTRNTPLTLTIRRAGRLINRAMVPVLCRHPEDRWSPHPRAMLGLFVEDPAAGVGTLTFYDPKTGTFAALGHRINELGGQNRIWLEGGKIVTASISGIEQGQRGNPGEKIGTFSGPDDIIGTIRGNTRFGLFGELTAPIEGREVPVALSHQVRTGAATILTVIRGMEIQEFAVEIIRIYQQSAPRDKGLVLKVTDPALLQTTGGIIQGMSGSPIIQDGRLVGAVTHVFINDPTRGFGVLAEWMLQEMDACAASPAA